MLSHSVALCHPDCLAAEQLLEVHEAASLAAVLAATPQMRARSVLTTALNLRQAEKSSALGAAVRLEERRTLHQDQVSVFKVLRTATCRLELDHLLDAIRVLLELPRISQISCLPLGTATD